jgi:uncharacterized Zn finger protein
MENIKIKKALSEKMCLLSATLSETNEWTFSVRGQSNNVYKQNFTKTLYSCSCPDHQERKTFCKHLLFLVIRVGKQYELSEDLAQRPKTTWKKNGFNTCSMSWRLCLSHLIGVKTETETETKTNDDDNSCSICYEDLGTDEIVECSKTCHKQFHKACMDIWLEHGDTCPNCRTDWSENTKIDDIKSSNIDNNNDKTIDEQIEVAVGSINPTVKPELMIGINNSDIVISFDTTGSMYPCLSEVRRNITLLTERLFREIPSLRVAIIAHGDYCDNEKKYNQLDFTYNQTDIKQFIENAPSTSGGDYPECYELVLHNCKKLSWRSDASVKSLILIGDAPPHEKNENPLKIDWRYEAETLKNRNIQVFSVQCLYHGNREAFNFYSDLAEITNGYHVFLDQFSYIKDMIQAICFKQFNQSYLEQFEKEVQTGSGGMSHSMRLMFDTMLGKKTRQQVKDEMKPSRFHERYTGSKSMSSTKKSSTKKSGITETSSTEHTDELRPSPPSRFQVFEVDENCGIKDFCAKMGITFAIGKGFYEFTKPEIIQDNKEIILMDKVTKELYEGSTARIIAGIGPNEKAKIKPSKLEKYRMFIQSKSPNRILIAKQGFLYEVSI